MKASTLWTARHPLVVGVASAFLALTALALLAQGHLLGDLAVFLMVGFLKPAAFIIVGVALYRYYKRPSRMVVLSPPFTPVTARSSS